MEINGGGFGRPLQDLEISAEKGLCGLSIVLLEKAPNNGVPWQLDVDVRYKNGGRVQLGSVVTLPSTSGALAQTNGGGFAQRPTSNSRVVAIASAPGAVGWWVRPSAAIGAQADLSLISGPNYGAQGLIALSPSGQPYPALPYRKDRNPALATSRVVIPTRTRLWAFQGQRVGGVGQAFVLGFDAAAVPAANTPADWSAPVAPNSPFQITPPFGPEEAANGLVWALSSTADVFTPTGNAELWVRTFFD